MDVKNLKEYILNLEKQLLKSEVRKSSQKIQQLLCDDFIEYTSSGHEYKYKKGDVFQKSSTCLGLQNFQITYTLG